MNIINTMLKKVPGQIVLPSGCWTVRAAQYCYRKVVIGHYNNEHKKDFEKLGITLPSDYA